MRRVRWASALTAIAIVHFIAHAANAQNGAGGWLHEFDQAVAAAKRQGKDLLIDFSGTDWCLPCKQLWNDVLCQREFQELASQDFVLLDIDLLVREEMPEGRKERYQALEKRYGIQAHPTVVLATAEGLPYATTGMLDKVNDPRGYWRHLAQLHKRGAELKTALADLHGQEAGAETLTRAKTIIAALADLRPDFVIQFYPETLELLRRSTPSDETGYLAFIDLHAALFQLEHKLHEAFLAGMTQWENDGERSTLSKTASAFSPRDVDAIIAKYRPQGASLREALVVRLFLEIDSGNWSQALTTLEAFADAQAPLSSFERACFVRYSVRSATELREHARAAQADAEEVAQVRAIYSMLKNDLEWSMTTLCCNHSFWLQLHWMLTGDAYGELLLRSTAHLTNDVRAAAIGKGLDGLDLYNNGSIHRIVFEVMPNLVGNDTAKKHLPQRYAEWLRMTDLPKQ